MNRITPKLILGFLLLAQWEPLTRLQGQETPIVEDWRQEGTPLIVTLPSPRSLLSGSNTETRDLSEALKTGAYNLLQSTELQRLLGLRAGTDEIEFNLVSTTQTGYHVVFNQYYRISGERIPVLWGQITVHTDFDGNARWISNNLEGNVQIDAGSTGRLLGPQRAIEMAIQEYEARGEKLPEVLPEKDEAKLVVWRIWSEGLENSKNDKREEKGYRDELIYNIPFSRVGAPELAGNVVAVNAVSGKVLYFEDTAMHASGGPDPQDKDICVLYPWLDCDCLKEDGFGTDRFLMERLFSTTKDKATSNFFTVSCNEFYSNPSANIFIGTFAERIWIYKKDPFFYDPNIADSGGQFRDYGSLYASLFNNFEPSVTELGFWSEEILAYFKSRGFTHRSAKDANGKPIPIEIHAKPDAIDWELWTDGYSGPDLFKWDGAHFLIPSLGLGTTSLKGNGFIRFGSGDGVKTTSCTDPQSIAHEFFHSVIFDQVEKGIIGPRSFNYRELHEGLSDTFAMIFSEHVIVGNVALNPGEWTVYPFHLQSRALVNFDDQQKGRPNLENPRKSPSIYKDLDLVWWAAQYGGQDHNPETLQLLDPDFVKKYKEKPSPHINSTLYSLAAKLLVTGERKNPSYPDWTVTPTGGKYALGSAGANEAEQRKLGFKRLEDLILEVVHNHSISPNGTASDFEAALVQAASDLEETKWGKFNGNNAMQRVEVAFNVLGWNYLQEEEPNDHESINVDSGSSISNKGGPKDNIIGVGKSQHSPISGSIDSGSGDSKDNEDYFVLNEKIFKGDTIHFSITQPNGAPLQKPLELRFYVEEACDMNEPQGSGPNCDKMLYCARERQVYPEVGYCGLPLNVPNPGTPPPQSGSFQVGKIGPCQKPDKPAGANCDASPNYVPQFLYTVYVAVKGCNCDEQKYKLEVWIDRTSPYGKLYWDEFP